MDKDVIYIILYLYYIVCVCLVTQSCLTLCNPMNCSPPGSFVHGNSPDLNTGVVYHDLLQGIFPTQGSNPGLPHCRQILYHLYHQGSPYIILYYIIYSSVMSDFFVAVQPHGLQHTRLPYPSPTPRIYSNSYPFHR